MDGLALAIGPDIADLAHAATEGDQTAFDRVVHLHAARVYRVALRMLGDREEAEDVQQETFVLAYHRLRTFRGEASFGTWLYPLRRPAQDRAVRARPTRSAAPSPSTAGAPRTPGSPARRPSGEKAQPKAT